MGKLIVLYKMKKKITHTMQHANMFSIESHVGENYCSQSCSNHQKNCNSGRKCLYPHYNSSHKSDLIDRSLDIFVLLTSLPA